MIYVNGTKIDFTNKDPNYQFAHVVSDYHDTIRKLKAKHGSAVWFNTPSTKPRIDAITKQQRKPKGYSWTTHTTIMTPDGGEAWVWSPAAAKVKDGVATSSQHNIMITMGDLTLDTDSDPEQIFFMTKIDAFKRGQLWIYDQNEEEDAVALERANARKLDNVIYGENSPLYIDTERLKIVASKWGVTNVENMSLNAVRNALYDTVVKGDDQKKKRSEGARGIAEFMADVSGGESVKIGSDIQGALDKGFLIQNRTAGEWQLKVKAGETPITLMSVGHVGGDIARARLIEYLVKNKADADLLSDVLKGSVKVEHGRVVPKKEDDVIIVPEDVNLDNIEELDAKGKPVVTFIMMQAAAKSLGIKGGVGFTYVKYKELVKEKLEQLALTT